MTALFIFKCTDGAGVGVYSCSFDTSARWKPVTQSARSRRSYGKIEDCEQSKALDIHDSGKISRKITHVITLHQSLKKVPRQLLS